MTKKAEFDVAVLVFLSIWSFGFFQIRPFGFGLIFPFFCSEIHPTDIQLRKFGLWLWLAYFGFFRGYLFHSILPAAVFSTDPAGVKVEDKAAKKKEASDLLPDEVGVKSVAAAVVGKSPGEVASAGAISESSGAADETGVESGAVRDEEKESWERKRLRYW